MVSIRNAVEADVPRILELYQQLSHNPSDYRHAPVSDCCDVLRRMQEYPGYSLLVAEDDGQVIGTTVMAVLPGFAHFTSPFAVIEYVVIDEKRRGRGIGKLLMEHCRKLAKEAGCYKIMLTSDNRRERAHKFYESLGYEASAHGFRYYFKD
jgi:GNAT superfamily N-acetyltransferase